MEISVLQSQWIFLDTFSYKKWHVSHTAVIFVIALRVYFCILVIRALLLFLLQICRLYFKKWKNIKSPLHTSRIILVINLVKTGIFFAICKNYLKFNSLWAKAMVKFNSLRGKAINPLFRWIKFMLSNLNANSAVNDVFERRCIINHRLAFARALARLLGYQPICVIR